MRKICILIGFVAVLGLVIPDATSILAPSAYAQETKKKKRKNLLELIFGGALQKQREQKKQRAAAKAAKKAKRVKVANTSKKKKRKKKAVAAVAAKPEVVKNEDAAKVLVVGDFMADHLSSGLVETFAENPGIVIVNKSVSLSGLVRNDVFDWPAEISGLIEETKPIAVVALVGMNDRQLIRTDNAKLKKLTDEWRAEYKRRADQLAKSIRDNRLPMIWVGLPPVSRRGMNADYLVQNSYYQTIVESYGGLFVDVWAGFTDDEGRYVRSGPDVNGQIVSLRRSDGINMTRSGKAKLGFFVEKAIKRLTGFGKNALVSSFGSLEELSISGEAQYDPIGSGKTVVVALGSPSSDGGTNLDGAEGFLSSTDARESSSFELVSNGLTAQPRTGRVDAGWGVPSFDLGRSETPEPVLANMRGVSYKSFLDDLPETGAEGEEGTSGAASQGAASEAATQAN